MRRTEYIAHALLAILIQIASRRIFTLIRKVILKLLLADAENEGRRALLRDRVPQNLRRRKRIVDGCEHENHRCLVAFHIVDHYERRLRDMR